MIDRYWMKRTGLGLPVALLVSLTRCGGQTMAPASEGETVETGTASGFVWSERALRRPAL